MSLNRSSSVSFLCTTFIKECWIQVQVILLHMNHIFSVYFKECFIVEAAV